MASAVAPVPYMRVIANERDSNLPTENGAGSVFSPALYFARLQALL